MSFVRLSVSCLYLLFLLFLVSCDDNEQIESAALASGTSPVSECESKGNTKPLIIIGDNDWIDYRETGNDPQDANELITAQVKIPAMLSSCTGFLINENTLMTNNHCIGSASAAVNVTAVFRDENGVRTTYTCNEFIMTSAVLDFTLVRCLNSPGQKYGWAGLSDTQADVGTQVYVVQENCDYVANPRCIINKYVGYGEALQSQKFRLYHDADTLGGSSGSPIFSQDSHQVIALHHAGWPATSTTAAMNVGIPMAQIVAKIKEVGGITTYAFGSAENVDEPGPTPTPDSNPVPGPTPTPAPTPICDN
jgi:V8-like Glu-specific endopeptidase